MTEDRLQHYSDIIIEHSQFPRHHGRLDNPTHQGQGENPFCGDRVCLQFTVKKDGLIDRVAAESTGCAISTASASLLASHLQGLSLRQARELSERVRAAIVRPPQADLDLDELLGELAALTFAGRYPSRVKCATLAWHVLNHALDHDDSVATTE